MTLTRVFCMLSLWCCQHTSLVVLDLFTNYKRSSSNYYTIRTYFTQTSNLIHKIWLRFFGSFWRFSNSLSGTDFLTMCLWPCDSPHTKILTIVWEVATNKHDLVPEASTLKGLRVVCMCNSWLFVPFLKPRSLLQNWFMTTYFHVPCC